MATTIFFNGRLISRPGSYSEVDATGLETVGFGATGIIALLGEAEGGRPVSAIETDEQIIRLLKPQDARNTFRSGDLREGASILFEPGRDAIVTSGAQEIVAMRVNPATQSTATFANSQGNALELTSLDWGAFTDQINVSIADGTIQGKLLTIIFEDITEAVDDLGGDDIFTLQYSGGADGYDTMVAGVYSGGVVKSTGTKDAAGADNLITTQLAVAGLVEVLSSDAGDTTQTVTLWGTNQAGTATQKEEVALNGTTVKTTNLQFKEVFGVSLDAAAAGIVTVRAAVAGAVIFDVPIGVLQEGAIKLEYGFVNNAVVALVSDGATVNRALVFGKNAAGADIGEIVTMTGTVPVNTVATFSRVERIVTGEIENAQTLTLTAVAAQTSATVHTTVQKAADYYNAKQVVLAGPVTRGFIFTIVTGQLSFLMTNLDITIADVSIATAVGFAADLWAIIDWVNTNSQLVSAAAATGASGGAPTNTTTPVFLAGGSEGTTTFQNWQDALDILKRVRVNTVVVLTGDQAVHAAVESHCAYMGGAGRSERDAFVGALNTAGDDVPTKTEYKAQAVALNSRHVRLVGQAIERFSTAGVRTEYLPPFSACVAAGMQAGSPVGTSLTNKYANVLGFRQDSSWNPGDDAEEMIQAGLLLLENQDGVGKRWIRNVTTHLSSDNIAFTEGSVNEAANFAAYNFRNAMEFFVGQTGFAGTPNAAKGLAINQLGLQVDAGILTGWAALSVEVVLDVLEVAVQIAPIVPINFVATVLHLVTQQQLDAAAAAV